MSAIRISPPPELVHGGKQVGVDEVEYVYKQVITLQEIMPYPADIHFSFAACFNPILPDRNCVG